MDLSDTESNNEITGNVFSSRSLTELLRTEVQKVLGEAIGQIINQETVDKIINKCLKKKLFAREPVDDKIDLECGDHRDANQQIEVGVEMHNDDGKSEIIFTNFQILENRIALIEEHINMILRNMRIQESGINEPEPNYIKLNTQTIKKELYQHFLNKKAANPSSMTLIDVAPKKAGEMVKGSTVEEMVKPIKAGNIKNGEKQVGKKNKKHKQKDDNILQVSSGSLQSVANVEKPVKKESKNKETVNEFLTIFQSVIDYNSDTAASASASPSSACCDMPHDVDIGRLLHYEEEQNMMNRLRYKKSKTTIELNERPVFNPLIKPIPMKEVLKKKSMTSNDKPRFVFNGDLE